VLPGGSAPSQSDPSQTFALSVGSQWVSLTPSFYTSDLILVSEDSCSNSTRLQGCSLAHPGALFQTSNSKTWISSTVTIPKGNFNDLIPYTKFQPGTKGPSYLVESGSDIVDLISSTGKNFEYRTRARINSNIDPSIPLLGLAPGTSTSAGDPSIVDALFEAKLINSPSWSYTAGKFSSLATRNGTDGSLVIGGFNSGACDFRNPDLTLTPEFTLPIFPNTTATDYLRIGGIEVSTSSSSRIAYTSNNLYRDISTDHRTYEPGLTNTYTIFDTTTPFIHLPTRHADALAASFGLQWDEDLQCYPVTSEQADAIQRSTPIVTMVLFSSTATSKSIRLTFDGRSLVLYAKQYQLLPTSGEPTLYLAVMRSDSKRRTVILGRAFLQEVCLAVRYSDQHMYMMQVNANDTKGDEVVPFELTKHPQRDTPLGEKQFHEYTTTYSGFNFNTVIAGSCVGVVVVMALIFWCFCSRRNRKKRQQIELAGKIEEEILERYGLTKTELPAESSDTTKGKTEDKTMGSVIQELDTEREERLVEANGDTIIVELDATSVFVEADGTPQSQLNGGQMEKGSYESQLAIIQREIPAWQRRFHRAP
jgi:Eukaryotic aspartyl protease